MNKRLLFFCLLVGVLSTYGCKGQDEVNEDGDVTSVQTEALTVGGNITRGQIIARAQIWSNNPRYYSQTAYDSQTGYRQDCSGYVSMAWYLRSSMSTVTLPSVAYEISKSDLKPGDVVMNGGPGTAGDAGHVIIFKGWADSAHTQFQAYEQTPPSTVYNPNRYYPGAPYKAYRYINVVEDGGEPDDPQTTHVTYQTHDNVSKRWLPNVTDTQDYAGTYGHDVDCIYASLSKGNITYRVHYKGGHWLPAVKNRSDYAGIYNAPIDGLMMTTDTGKTVHYRVHLKRTGAWLPYVTGYNENDADNGYAGNLGQEIDAVEVYLD